jgi:lipooligosaccharide transport system permease protein
VDRRRRGGGDDAVPPEAGEVTAVLRIVPMTLRTARRPQRLLERAYIYNRRMWIIIVSGFFEPLFYLLSIRVGISDLVGNIDVGGRTVEYASFVAPALMASSAMNGAVYDSTMNVFHKLKYAKLYDAMLSTPLGPGDVALGEIGWALVRGLLYAITFLGVLVAMGLTNSWWVILSIPACSLIGLAFASCGMAATTYLRGWSDFEFVPLVQMPMFLFSATFYPASTYGDVGQVLLQVSPLYHGVTLVRAANDGVWAWSLVGHVAFLVAMSAAGLVIAARRLEQLLIS